MKLRELLNQMELTYKEIGSSEPFICGGTPRDKYMNKLSNISDLDITTGDKSVDYLSQEFYAYLKKKYNLSRKSMDDGHSTIFIGNLKLDFSSNFNVPNIDQILKKQGIQNPTEMQKELYSRDFTCNSLLLSLDLKNIFDITKMGVQDIENKIIRTCLAPEVTLTTNRNRVVRAIYLAAKLGFDLDEKIIQFVRAKPESIKISTEKSLVEKLNEAFKRDGDRTSNLLTKMNLWNHIPITDLAHPYYLQHVKRQGQ
jgi:tRNA nucleotidyltransferase/poly(A) polymerase